MSGKLVVTPETGGGTRITIYGSSGTELVHSETFKDPRAKGATLRALKGLMGENVTVEDLTTARRQPTMTSMPTSARVRTAGTGTTRRTTGRTGRPLRARGR